MDVVKLEWKLTCKVKLTWAVPSSLWPGSARADRSITKYQGILSVTRYTVVGFPGNHGGLGRRSERASAQGEKVAARARNDRESTAWAHLVASAACATIVAAAEIRIRRWQRQLQ